MNNYNINSYRNIFSLNNLFSSNLNLLDNFQYIYYKGTILPRIKLDSFNYNNLEDFIYSPIEDIEYYKSKKNVKEKSNNNIEIHISREESNIEIRKFFNFIRNDIKDDIINRNEKKEHYKCIFKDKNNIEPIPPKNIISILNDHEYIKNRNLIKNDINFTINTIILNNIDLLAKYDNMKFYYNPIFYKNYRIKNQIILDFSPNILRNKSLFDDKESIVSSFNYVSEQKISKPLFEVSSNFLNENNKIYLKRGRKVKKKRKNHRIHSSFDDDNILRKIQVHFFSFIINYSNDVIKTLINNKDPPLFKKIDYSIKKIVNYKNIECLKSKNISEILKFPVSPKLKNHDKNTNEKIYYIICKMFPFFVEFSKKSYISLFNEYYYNNNKYFQLNGKKINLSLKTETFNDLITKYDKLKDKLKYVAIKYLINPNNKCLKESRQNYIFQIYK